MRAEKTSPPAAPSPSAAGSSTAASAPAAVAPAAAAEQGQGVEIFSINRVSRHVFLRVRVFEKVRFKAFAFNGLSLNQGRVKAVLSSSGGGEGYTFTFRRPLPEGAILILEIIKKCGDCSRISRVFFMVDLEKRWIMKRNGMLLIARNLQLIPSIELFYDDRREIAEEQLKRVYGASSADMFSPALYALWKFFFPQFFKER